MFNNECIKHGLKWDFDGNCPHCAREEYEARFKAECFRNAEEKHRRYINEQNQTIISLKSSNNELREALEEALNYVKKSNRYEIESTLEIKIKQALEKCKE